MEAWRRLGNFVGSHMAFISPLCVVLGVLFPEQLGVFKPWVTGLFAFVTFQSSLSNNFLNLAHTLRHPKALLTTVLITVVIMPVVAFALGSLFFGDDPNLVCGIVIEYSVPIAVSSAMWVSMCDGDGALGLATIIVVTVLAPFSIPLTLQVLLGQTVEVDVMGMMSDMLVSIAIPAVVGIALNDATHGWAKERLSPVLSPAARLTLVFIITVNCTGISEYVRHLTPELVAVAAFILVYAILGYVVGFVVARALHWPRGAVVTMTFQVGMRNISAGAVIAAEYFPDEVMFPVMIGTLFQQMLASFAATYLQRRLPAEEADGGADEGAAADLPRES